MISTLVDWNYPPAFPAGIPTSAPGHLATPSEESSAEFTVQTPDTEINSPKSSEEESSSHLLVHEEVMMQKDSENALVDNMETLADEATLSIPEPALVEDHESQLSSQTLLVDPSSSNILPEVISTFVDWNYSPASPAGIPTSAQGHFSSEESNAEFTVQTLDTEINSSKSREEEVIMQDSDNALVDDTETMADEATLSVPEPALVEDYESQLSSQTLVIDPSSSNILPEVISTFVDCPPACPARIPTSSQGHFSSEESNAEFTVQTMDTEIDFPKLSEESSSQILVHEEVMTQKDLDSVLVDSTETMADDAILSVSEPALVEDRESQLSSQTLFVDPSSSNILPEVIFDWNYLAASPTGIPTSAPDHLATLSEKSNAEFTVQTLDTEINSPKSSEEESSSQLLVHEEAMTQKDSGNSLVDNMETLADEATSSIPEPALVEDHESQLSSQTLVADSSSSNMLPEGISPFVDWSYPSAFPAGIPASAPGHLVTPSKENNAEFTVQTLDTEINFPKSSEEESSSQLLVHEEVITQKDSDDVLVDNTETLVDEATLSIREPALVEDHESQLSSQSLVVDSSSSNILPEEISAFVDWSYPTAFPAGIPASAPGHLATPLEESSVEFTVQTMNTEINFPKSSEEESSSQLLVHEEEITQKDSDEALVDNTETLADEATLSIREPALVEDHESHLSSQTLVDSFSSNTLPEGISAFVDWSCPPAFPAGIPASAPGHLATPSEESSAEFTVQTLDTGIDFPKSSEEESSSQFLVHEEVITQKDSDDVLVDNTETLADEGTLSIQEPALVEDHESHLSSQTLVVGPSFSNILFNGIAEHGEGVMAEEAAQEHKIVEITPEDVTLVDGNESALAQKNIKESVDDEIESGGVDISMQETEVIGKSFTSPGLLLPILILRRCRWFFNIGGVEFTRCSSQRRR